jgi:hypothetical protein
MRPLQTSGGPPRSSERTRAALACLSFRLLLLLAVGGSAFGCGGQDRCLWLADRGGERLWLLDARGRVLAQRRFPGARALAREAGEEGAVWLGGGLGSGPPTCWWLCRFEAGAGLSSRGPFRTPGSGERSLEPGFVLDPAAQPLLVSLPEGRHLEVRLGSLIERDGLGRARWSQGGFQALEGLLVLPVGR